MNRELSSNRIAFTVKSEGSSLIHLKDTLSIAETCQGGRSYDIPFLAAIHRLL